MSTPNLTPEQLAALPHDDIGGQLLASVWSLCGLATVFILLRITCKSIGKRGLWWDDYILIGAYIALVAECGLTTSMVSLGFGKHLWDFPQENIVPWVIRSNARTTLTVTAAAWSKTAFAITLLRICNKGIKWFIWFLIITINITMGLSGLFVWINCTPIRKSWNPLIEGTCWPAHISVSYNIFSAAYSGAGDIILALLPWTVLRTLQMVRNEKIGVGLAMSMGIFAGITAFIKTSKLNTLTATDFQSPVQLVIWDTAETSVTIMAASIPVLRVLIRHVASSISRNYVNDRSQPGDGSRQIQSRSHASHIATVTSPRRHHRHSDEMSDTSILADQHKVRCRTDVAVEYFPREDENSYEMTSIRSSH